MADVEQTVVADVTPVVTEAKGFFASIYDKIVAEAKAIESDAVAVEALVKSKIEAFAAGVSSALHGLHADATKVETTVTTDVADVEKKV